MLHHMVANRCRDGNDMLAAHHDRTVPARPIEAMQAGHQRRPLRGRQTFPCSVRHPRRQPRAQMQNIRARLAQQAPDSGYPAQGRQALGAYIPVQMFAAFGLQLFHHPPAGGDHDGTMSFPKQATRHFQGAALHTAHLQGGQHLYHGQHTLRRSRQGRQILSSAGISRSRSVRIH